MTSQTIMPDTQNSEKEIKKDMDNMYRWTRHIYDITRKYYLLGRDHLIANLAAKDNQVVCEVGCGTARNLVKIAKRYPNAKFYGLDASDEMLKTAQHNVDHANMHNQITLKQGFSQSFHPNDLFEIEQPLDKIVFSYALSIIPPWKESIDHAIELLPSGGEIHIVDFGGQKRLPKPVRAFIFWWLQKFHVYYKPEILRYLKKLNRADVGSLEIKYLYRGYTYHAVLKKK
ncbi:MAG: class I SAM-dependent methyltransferase [Alphaproteobacteria bacterium]